MENGKTVLGSSYLENLKKYIGKDINILDNGNEVRVYVDAEIQYFLKEDNQRYILYMQERGIETKEKEYAVEKEMQRNVAILLKNVFNEEVKYPFSGKFRDIATISELKNTMSQCVDKKLYSVSSLEKDKINIEQNEGGLYSIFFLDKNGEKYILEQDEEAPFVFKRFYNEVLYYGETLKQIEEYEDIFGDKLEYSIKLELLGY